MSNRFTKSPTGFTRWFLRMPIYLYRMNLGWLLGSRFMLINHVGRKSGLPRQTVVEVVYHDESSDTYYVASGWGFKSQWYQNILAHPDITIQVGRRKLAVHAESPAPEKGAEVLMAYRDKHPTAAKTLSRMMGKDIHDTSTEELADLIRNTLPLITMQVKATD